MSGVGRRETEGATRIRPYARLRNGPFRREPRPQRDHYLRRASTFVACDET